MQQFQYQKDKNNLFHKIKRIFQNFYVLSFDEKKEIKIMRTGFNWNNNLSYINNLIYV